MKIQLNSKISDICIAIYLIGMLYYRFQIETSLEGNYVVSILFGVMTLFFLYFLISKKVLNPTYFGLLKKESTRASRRREKKAIES